MLAMDARLPAAPHTLNELTPEDAAAAGGRTSAYIRPAGPGAFASVSVKHCRCN